MNKSLKYDCVFCVMTAIKNGLEENPPSREKILDAIFGLDELRHRCTVEQHDNFTLKYIEKLAVIEDKIKDSDFDSIWAIIEEVDYTVDLEDRTRKNKLSEHLVSQGRAFRN